VVNYTVAKTFHDQGEFWNILRLHDHSVATNDHCRVKREIGQPDTVSIIKKNGKDKASLTFSWVFEPGSKTVRLATLVTAGLIYGLASSDVVLVMDGQSCGGKSWTMSNDSDANILS
jgi:hypothetical protein